MRREVILLVAGVAAVAALPVQESAAQTQQADLRKLIFIADPEENDLFADDSDKLPVSHTKAGEQALREAVKEQPQQQSQLQDPPKEQKQPQNLLEEQKLTSPRDPLMEQKQISTKDSPDEQKEIEPGSPLKEESQSQPQAHETELSLLDRTDESSVKESIRPIVVDTQENLTVVLEDLMGDEAISFDSEMEGLRIEPKDDYEILNKKRDMVLHVKEETPFHDNEGTFTYGLLDEKTSFDQEQGEHLYNPELPSEPQMDSITFESEPLIDPVLVDLHPEIDPISYDYEEPQGREESLSIDSQTESDYEQLPWDVKEGPSDEYDYGLPAETYQPNHEEHVSLEPEKVSAEDSYYSDEDVAAEPVLVLQPQMHPVSYDSEIPLNREEFSSDPQTESDHEQLPWDIREGPDDEYDYELPAETYQPNQEENKSLEPESVSAEDSYYSNEGDVPPEPFLVELHPLIHPISYNSVVPLSQEEFSSDPWTESDYEQLPWDIREGPKDEFDYDLPAETYQPNHEENISLEPESVSAEDSYYSDQGAVPADLLSWLVPDFFNEEPTDNDGSHYDSSYYDQVPTIEDYTQNKPGRTFEEQVSDVAAWEEPAISRVNGANEFLDGSLQGNEEDVVVVEEVPLDMTDSSKRGTEDVSLVDYFIPTYSDPIYSGALQEYSSDATPFNEDEEFVSSDGEVFPVDDSFIQMEPLFKTDLVELEALSENNPSEDKYEAQWSAESDREDKRMLPEGDETVTIIETQPIHIPVVKTESSYPTLLKIMEKDVAKGQDEPWSNARSLMTDNTPEADTMADSSTKENYFSESHDDDDDAMEIIMTYDPRENLNNFPSTPAVHFSHNIEERPQPMAWYPEGDHQQSYWVPYRSLDKPVPKIYYSFTNEFQRKKFPRSFGPMNDLTFSPFLSGRPHKTAVTEDPFSFMNEIPEEMPPQFLASTSTLAHQKFKGPEFPFSKRNYPDIFITPRLSFRDLLQSLDPSSYNKNVNGYQRQNPQHNSQSYNPFLRYNGPSKHYSYTSPPLPYSSPFNSFQDNDYLLEEYHYPNRLDRISSYETNDMSPSIFQEDTMQGMYSQGPKRHYEDYTKEYPFMSSNSYSGPPSPFTIYDGHQYDGSSPSFNRPHYSQNSYYSMGPYHPKPIYLRYAPMYYGM